MLALSTTLNTESMVKSHSLVYFVTQLHILTSTKTPHLIVNVNISKTDQTDQTKVMNFSALYHLIRQAYLMKTKLL